MAHIRRMITQEGNFLSLRRWDKTARRYAYEGVTIGKPVRFIANESSSSSNGFGSVELPIGRCLALSALDTASASTCSTDSCRGEAPSRMPSLGAGFLTAFQQGHHVSLQFYQSNQNVGRENKFNMQIHGTYHPPDPNTPTTSRSSSNGPTLGLGTFVDRLSNRGLSWLSSTPTRD